MPRKVFLSFHCDNDIWRVRQLRELAAIDCQSLLSLSEWERVRRKGDVAVQDWIEGALKGRACAIVCIGEHTAGRHWVNHEIAKAWSNGMGVFGLKIHKLKDKRGVQSGPGGNPFHYVKLADPSLGHRLAIHDPPFSDAEACLRFISVNIENWIDEAVAFRAQYP